MSVLMFLAIMTSRYAEEDFYKSLPQKLIIGLATLFISMASILISFGAAFTIVLRQKYSWAPFPVASFGLVSVLLFAFSEFPLFLEMVYFTDFISGWNNISCVGQCLLLVISWLSLVQLFFCSHNVMGIVVL